MGTGAELEAGEEELKRREPRAGMEGAVGMDGAAGMVGQERLEDGDVEEEGTLEEETEGEGEEVEGARDSSCFDRSGGATGRYEGGFPDGGGGAASEFGLRGGGFLRGGRTDDEEFVTASMLAVGKERDEGGRGGGTGAEGFELDGCVEEEGWGFEAGGLANPADCCPTELEGGAATCTEGARIFAWCRVVPAMVTLVDLFSGENSTCSFPLLCDGCVPNPIALPALSRSLFSC